MIKLFKSKGFSLVELMIVVAIMAILAAVAIPSYLRFQIKARESEMRINLAAIRVCEEAYKAEHDVYLTCTASPNPAPTGSVPETWGDEGGFDDIGFEPDGDVRYQYAVAIATGGGTVSTTYNATATGDVDGDGNPVTWTVTESSAIADNGGDTDH